MGLVPLRGWWRSLEMAPLLCKKSFRFLRDICIQITLTYSLVYRALRERRVSFVLNNTDPWLLRYVQIRVKILSARAWRALPIWPASFLDSSENMSDSYLRIISPATAGHSSTSRQACLHVRYLVIWGYSRCGHCPPRIREVIDYPVNFGPLPPRRS